MRSFTNITKTLFSFFNSLGYEVYLEGQISESAKFPYIIISYQLEEFGVDSLIQGQIRDKSYSRETVNRISDELLSVIQNGIKIRTTDNEGYLYLRRGSPFIQPINDIEGLQVNYFNIIMKSFY